MISFLAVLPFKKDRYKQFSYHFYTIIQTKSIVLGPVARFSFLYSFLYNHFQEVQNEIDFALDPHRGIFTFEKGQPV